MLAGGVDSGNHRVTTSGSGPGPLGRVTRSRDRQHVAISGARAQDQSPRSVPGGLGGGIVFGEAMVHKAMPAYDVPTMFRYADMLRWVVQTIVGNSPAPRPREWAWAVATNIALATEIYLKCLGIVDKGEAPWGHDIDDLVDALTPESMEAVRHFYSLVWQNDPDCRFFLEWERRWSADPEATFSFDAVLLKSAEAFTRLRYGYEGKESECLLLPLALAVRHRILMLRPDLEPGNESRA